MSIRGVGAARVFALVGAVLASGCGDRFLYTPLNTPPRPMARRPGAAVEVLVVTPPARPHTDVGLIQSFASSNWSSVPAAEMIGKLREHAGALGCDAVLITSIDRQVSRYHTQSIQASCVVYDDAPPITPPCR